jgi:RNA methyltransferase, TrmH family
MTHKELKFFSNLQKKEYRDREHLFLIEGIHLIDECLTSKYYSRNIHRIFVKKDFSDKLSGKLLASGIIPEVISDIQFNKLSETKNPQGIIGVVSIHNEKNFLSENDKLIIALDDLNDPGNLGTILRTCWWYGVDKIYLSSNSVDIYNSKVIRSSQGALFNLDLISDVNFKIELLKLQKKGWSVYLTAVKAEMFLDEINIDIKKKNIIVFGNEANGVNVELLSNNNFRKIKIKGYSKCESLNVGVSAGIILDYFRNKC